VNRESLLIWGRSTRAPETMRPQRGGLVRQRKPDGSWFCMTRVSLTESPSSLVRAWNRAAHCLGAGGPWRGCGRQRHRTDVHGVGSSGQPAEAVVSEIVGTGGKAIADVTSVATERGGGRVVHRTPSYSGASMYCSQRRAQPGRFRDSRSPCGRRPLAERMRMAKYGKPEEMDGSLTTSAAGLTARHRPWANPKLPTPRRRLR